MAIWKRQQQPADPKALQQVETLLTKAVAIDPKCGDAYLQLGILSSSQHHFEKAIGFYTKAIEVDPQLGEAHYRLGVAYDRIGSPEKARRNFSCMTRSKSCRQLLSNASGVRLSSSW
jgi:tetratricopeptide (TPR) repeat protein